MPPLRFFEAQSLQRRLAPIQASQDVGDVCTLSGLPESSLVSAHGSRGFNFWEELCDG
jgi:hypothetical protein